MATVTPRCCKSTPKREILVAFASKCLHIPYSLDHSVSLGYGHKLPLAAFPTNMPGSSQPPPTHFYSLPSYPPYYPYFTSYVTFFCNYFHVFYNTSSPSISPHFCLFQLLPFFYHFAVSPCLVVTVVQFPNPAGFASSL